MEMNFVAIILIAFVPMVLGFIWYNPKTLGSAWMKACNLTEEDLKQGNMLVVFGVSFLLSIMLAFSLQFATIHQFGIFGAFEGTLDNPEMKTLYDTVMAKVGNNFRYFRHGFLHGGMVAVFTILPVLATNALFERKSVKYVFINFGYWFFCFAIMGGLLCKYAVQF